VENTLTIPLPPSNLPLSLPALTQRKIHNLTLQTSGNFNPGLTSLAVTTFPTSSKTIDVGIKLYFLATTGVKGSQRCNIMELTWTEDADWSIVATQISETGRPALNVGVALTVTAVMSPLEIYVFYIDSDENLAGVAYIDGTWLPGAFTFCFSLLTEFQALP
jgi:hypothetical protein